MTLDLVLKTGFQNTLLPGNQHYLDPTGRRITGADLFRITASVIVQPADAELYADLERGLQPEHHAGGRPYGLALLEAQQIGIMHVTTPEVIEGFRAGTPLPVGGSNCYGGWPVGQSWEDALPKVTWFPGGEGVLGEYDNAAGGKVTLIEYMVDRAQKYNDRVEPVGELAPMVTYHCDRCHRPEMFDLGEKYQNEGPGDRSWTASKARTHARGKDGKCTPVDDSHMRRVVEQVVSEHQGRTMTLPTRESACSLDGGCSLVRHARAVTANLTDHA
jgi:hypothetical protein